MIAGCRSRFIADLAGILVLGLAGSNTMAQADFSIPDTICINDSVVIENLSRNADTYYWNFCSGNLIHDPGGENLTSAGTLRRPGFIDFAEDNGTFYSFITNHQDGSLVRNTYGSDFLSTPASVNLGNFGGIIPTHAQGIQIISYNNEWYGFIVGGLGDESRLIRLNFGNSLSNNPTLTNLGNPGDILDYPIDLYITNEAGNWIGFTVNYDNNALIRLNFGNSLMNNPVFENLGNFGFKNPCGILPINDNGTWHIFVSNFGSHEITRLDFGGSLLSIPGATSIGDNTVLNNPFDLTIIRDCENTYGFVLNRYNDIVRLVFNNGLDNPPEYTSLGEIGNLYGPQGISDVFRVGDTLYAFVANIDNNTLTRLYFPGCNNATPPSSTLRTPPPVTYNAPGVYNINLVIDEGQTDQENGCRNIVVVDSVYMSLGNDTLITPGTSIELTPEGTYTSYLWSTGSSEPSITISDAGTYTLTVTNRFGCQTTDVIEVIADIGIPNFFTPNGDNHNDEWTIPFLISQPEADIMVFDRFGNLLTRYKASEGNWDGTSKGKPLPTGTYWYVISVPGIDKPFKGAVTIKR